MNKHKTQDKPYTYSYFGIFTCIYSVTGEIYQMQTNASRYSTCCAADVYMFVYIFVGALIVALNQRPSPGNDEFKIENDYLCVCLYTQSF